MARDTIVADFDEATETATAAALISADLIISEIVEGSSNNKAVELYNGTGADVDLAAAGYVLSFYFNGSTTAGTTIALTGTIAAGATYVIADDGAAQAILDAADQLSTSNFFNGDDAIVLTRGGAVVDSFGQVGVDPGAEWTGGGQDDTLRRVAAPDADTTDAFDASAQWEAFATDDFSDLGQYQAAEPQALVINEVLGSTTGSDSEYIELFGTPGASLAGLSLIVVESDDQADNGAIDFRYDFAAGDALGENGFFLLSNALAEATYGVTADASIADNSIENSAYTLALVETASIAGTSVSGAETVVDAVAVTDANGGTFWFGAPVVGPDGTNLPAGVGRVVDGADTDTAADWQLLDFLNGPPNDPTPGQEQDVEPEDPVLIWAVQGSGAASPLLGQTVTVEAIVVGDFQGGGALQGFFLQEQDADADGDAMTSEGIFVFDGSAPAADVAAGDLVRVTGTVAEFLGKTQLSGVTVEVVSGGNALPTAAEITFPVASLAESGGQLTADLEMYEGMLVTVPQELTVGDVFNLGRFGEIDLSALGTIPTYTQVNAPDVSGYQAYAEEAARNAIILDDGSNIQNPSVIPFEIAGEPGTIAGEFDAADELGSGDTVSGLTGVLDYGFNQFRIHATETPEFENANPREETPPEIGGSLTVATFNVLNYFTTLLDEGLTSGPGGLEPRGADNDEEFARQTDKLIAALGEIQADVFGLIEIENEFGDQNGDGEFAIETLVATLNQATGMSYAFVDPGTGYLGSDAIAVGLIYNTQTVRLADDTSVAFLTDADLAGLGLDFGNPVFEGEGTSRVPLAASFEQVSSGEVFTVAVNHFKSKGSASPFGDNADAGDGAGASNEARLQAAIALDAWLDSDPTGSGDPDVMITGDLNAYAMEDPVRFLLDQGYVDTVAAFGGGGDYTYGFPLAGEVPQAQGFGTLDYALASASLFGQVAGADVWNINADEASTIDYNLNFKPVDQQADLFAPDPFRSSDHDPVLVGLALQSRELVAGRPGSGPVFGTDAAEIIDGLGGRADTARGFGGSDIFRFTDIEGQRDALNILDYTPGEDLLDLNGNELVDYRVLGANLRLELDGSDGDYIMLRGVNDIDDVTFVDDPFAVA